MIQELSKYVDIKDQNIQQALKELKILELEIPFDQQQQLVKEIFNQQLESSMLNQKYQIQVGNASDIGLINEQEYKPALCEYLESQSNTFMELIDDIGQQIQALSNTFDSKQASECRLELQKCQEENQKQIIALSSSQIESFDPQVSKFDILKNEMNKFIKEQRNLIVYKKQIQQLEQKMKENRRIVFENIEEKNEISELVAQKMEMNIDSELKLLEKTTELKIIVKIENDLQQEVLKMEKNNANNVFNSEDQPIQNVEQLEKQISQLFNQICQMFQEIKEQKVKNNDFIFDQILANCQQQLTTLEKLSGQHQANTHQLIDYLNNYPNIQQIMSEDVEDKIEEQKNDYLFCQKIQNAQQQKQNEEEQIDEFLKLTKNYELMQNQTQKQAIDFNLKLDKQYELLQNLKEYLLQLNNF